MIRRLFCTLLALTCVPQYSFAELSQDEHHQLEEFVSGYKRLHTLSEFMDASSLSVAEYIFLKNKAAGALQRPLPKLRLLNDSLQFDDRGDIYTLRVLSLKNHKYSMNGKTMDFTKPMSIGEKWELIERSLPKNRLNAWRLLIPEARASFRDPMFWIGVTALIFSLTGPILNVRASDQSNCRDNWTAVDDCKRQLGLVNDYTRLGVARFQKLESQQPVAKESDPDSKKEAAQAEATNWRDMVDQMRKGQCPVTPINPDLDRETSQVVSSVLRTGDAKKTLWDDCDTRARSQITDCVQKLASVSKDVCFNLTTAAYEGITDKKLEGPPNLATATKGIVPAVNPQDPPLPPVKAVEEKADEK